MDDNTEKKQRLLIVDDSKVIRVTARKILRDHFETIEAVDGENAWKILSDDAAVALVVSDLNMPGLDGFGLLERIRGSHLPQVSELPVIIITGANDTEATKQRAREIGATDFISKPFDAIHLLARTQAHANSRAASNKLREENTLLEDRSTVDAATGLCNETAFMERGYQLLSYAIRHDSSLATFRIEIDGFGDLYREHGAGMTNSVVQAMGRILAAVIRQEDIAARIGPARFALLLPGMDTSGVRKLAGRISREFSACSFNAGDRRTHVTASIGIHSPDIRRNTRFEELLSVADQHLVLAASRGGNRVVDDAGGTAPVPETGVVVDSTAAGPASAAHPGSDGTTSPTLEMLLAGDAALEIEEIELTATGFSLPQPRVRDTAPATGSTDPPAPGSPAVFSVEPGPEGTADIPPAGILSVGAPASAKSPEKMPAEQPGTSAAVIDGEAHETAMTGPIEDTIDISAPFSAHSATIRGVDATGAMKSAPDLSDAPAAGSDSDNADGDGTPPRRRGLFRKTLGLFGRSRSRK